MMKRRHFLAAAVTGATAMTLPQFLHAAPDAMPKRKLGRTGESLSLLGFGGILVMNEEQPVANHMVAQAFDHGINYYDVAPSYGNAEEKLGPALEPYRKRCFLACKTNQRKADDALRELENSLRVLRTDHFDLYQMHHLTSDEDIETAFGPSGALETFVKAKEKGLVRFLGFSAHSEKAALTALSRFDFDTILFPINFVNWYEGNFGPQVVAMAKEKGMGILALKGLAFSARKSEQEFLYHKIWYNPIAPDADETARLALNWTFMQGVTAAIPPGEPMFWDRAFRIAANASPLQEDEIEKLKKIARGVEPVFRS